MTRRDAGFTLLEILVALAVLGFLMVALSQGTRFGLLAWDRQSRLIAQHGEMDAIDRLLRRLVGQMQPGNRIDPPLVQGDARSLAFVTDLGPAVGPLGEREAEVRLSVEAGRLLLRWRPHRHVQRLAPPPAPTESELLRNVAGLELAYWGPGAEGAAPAWRSEWNALALPGLVRLRLRFPQGDPRRWPDIIAAPMRERLQQ